jgi:hypothetical protein
VSIGDFNDDGRADLAVPDGAQNSVSVLVSSLGTATGTITESDLPPSESVVIQTFSSVNGILQVQLQLSRPSIGAVTGIITVSGGEPTGAGGPGGNGPYHGPLKVAFAFDAGSSKTVANGGQYTPDPGNPVMPVLTQVNLPLPPGDPLVAVGTATGYARVQVYDTHTGELLKDFYAYDGSVTGGVRVALGDVNGDGVQDIVTVPGPGGPPEVKVFDGVSGGVIRDFYAFPGYLRTGFFIAAGDLNGDDFADLVVAPDAGAASEVKVINGSTTVLMYDFYAYGAFAGGVRLAIGDVNGDGKPEIITSPGAGMAALIEAFSGGLPLRAFYAFTGSYTGGVSVAAGASSTGQFTLVVGMGSGSSEVKVFDGSGAAQFDFYAFDAAFRNGVAVAISADLSGHLYVLVGAGDNTELRGWLFTPFVLQFDFYAYGSVGVVIGGNG